MKYVIEITKRDVYTVEAETAEEARELAEKIENGVKAIKQEYMDNNPLVIDKEVEDIMNNVLIEVLKFSFKKEIGCKVWLGY